MLRFALCLFLAATITCHQYTPLCQNWCCEQQPIVYPQLCNSYCGSYSGSCNPCVPQPPYPYYPNGFYPSYPVNPTTNPSVPDGSNILKFAVYTGALICPPDPQPRVGNIAPAPPSKLIACELDEDCVSDPVIQKCCHDQGIGDKVCKPAIRA